METQEQSIPEQPLPHTNEDIKEANPEIDEIISKDTRKAIDVLREKMLFYDTIAQRLLIKIIKALKQEKGNGVLLAQMYKKFSECDAVVIDCATKLANYQSAKLSSQEVKKDITHRYIMRAPEAPTDTKEWLNKVKPEFDAAIAKAEEQVTKLINNHQEIVEDVEYEEIED